MVELKSLFSVDSLRCVGYRYVKPYVFKFQTYAKERWFGRTVINIFTTEFGSFSPEYYALAIETGRVTLNGARTTATTVVKNGDLLCHKTHRHEPPVSGETIEVAHETPDLLVVSKPAGIPTHPCGAYRFNSLHYILLHMRPDIPHLHIVHRLDRLTSGVVILAKNSNTARKLSACIADRTASKAYLARVRGTFPDTLTESWLHQIQSQLSTPRATVTIQPDDATMLNIKCPLVCRSHKDGVWACADKNDQDVKEAETLVQFHKRHDEDDTTVVLVKPVTGRTHQIRLHLQLLGLPIANDPCYGGVLHFGSSLASLSDSPSVSGAKTEEEDKENDESHGLPQQEGESDDAFLERTCEWCASGRRSDNKNHCACIWLHAWQYELLGETYRVASPSWV
ncbi:hypothetical protein AC1031_006674 [Aphanomyces cochlioides]|nr:hypothetical protein AC1031_006674 [Aphanomyces cochlioides]